MFFQMKVTPEDSEVLFVIFCDQNLAGSSRIFQSGGSFYTNIPRDDVKFKTAWKEDPGMQKTCTLGGKNQNQHLEYNFVFVWTDVWTCCILFLLFELKMNINSQWIWISLPQHTLSVNKFNKIINLISPDFQQCI